MFAHTRSRSLARIKWGKRKMEIRRNESRRKEYTAENVFLCFPNSFSVSCCSVPAHCLLAFDEHCRRRRRMANEFFLRKR